MSRRRILLAVGAGVALSASIALARRPAAAGEVAPAHGSPPGEVARIQAHLAAVERELLARDVSHLTPDQRAARARNIAVLRGYRERGIFPHNHDFAGERVPYFVDEHGTLCAMAYLIQQSGSGDLVSRVAATANNARIPELAGDRELVAWLDANGLTLAEAARVQPSYDDGGCVACFEVPDERERVTARYGTASAVASGSALAALVWNLRRAGPERTTGRSVAGLAAGAVALWLGASQFDESGAPLALGATNAAIGAASTAFAVRHLFRPAPSPAATDTDAAPAPDVRSAAISVSPHVELRNGAVGVRVGLTF